MIRVEQLTKHFRKTVAVDNISFHVEQGEVFGFIGPNGAGKTTTIKMIATLLEPTTGTIHVDGVSVTSYPEQVRKLIGYMADDFGVYDGIQVDEYIEFFAAAYRIPSKKRKAICRDVMELTDLTGLRTKMVSDLSKGMKQRLCLARSLVHDPKVLILDEPAAGLDPRARIEFRELVKELHTMGKTIFISSHILSELSDICTTVGIIESGKLLVSGKVSDIVKELTRGTELVITIDGPPDNAMMILQQHEHVSEVRQEDGSLRVVYEGDGAQASQLIKELINHDIAVRAFHEEKKDLEKLFMQITRGDVA